MGEKQHAACLNKRLCLGIQKSRAWGCALCRKSKKSFPFCQCLGGVYPFFLSNALILNNAGSLMLIRVLCIRGSSYFSHRMVYFAALRSVVLCSELTPLRLKDTNLEIPLNNEQELAYVLRKFSSQVNTCDYYFIINNTSYVRTNYFVYLCLFFGGRLAGGQEIDHLCGVETHNSAQAK